MVVAVANHKMSPEINSRPQLMLPSGVSRNDVFQLWKWRNVSCGVSSNEIKEIYEQQILYNKSMFSVASLCHL